MAHRAIILAVAVVGCATPEPELGSSTSALVDPSAFVLPSLTAPQRAQIVHGYAALDPGHAVPRALLEDAIVYFDWNKVQIPKTDYFAVVDFSQYSGHDRFWLVDVATGAVENHKVAHGAGSDPSNTGYATSFGNVSGSYKSSLGFYLTGEIYDGTHPHSMRLDGLSPDGSPNGMADTNVRPRLIVMHEASYVSDSNTGQQGRSDGCLALDPAIEVSVVDRIHDGSLIYAASSPLAPAVGPGSCGDGTCDPDEDQPSCPEDCGACGTIDAAGGVVDDSGACFTAGGPANRLHKETTAGVGNTLQWAPASSLLVPQSFAEWSLDFAAAGRYRVEVYTAAAFAQSKHAGYVVRASGTDHTVPIDQTALDGYQSLGEFDFAQGAHQRVRLDDNTGEPPVQLVFDAVRLTRVDGGMGSGSGSGSGPGDGPGGAAGSGGGGCSTSGGGVGFAIALALVGLRRRRTRDQRPAKH